MTTTRLPTRWAARWIAVLTLTTFGTIGLASAAGAHTDLTESDPADGSTLTAAPAAIALTFNEPVQNFAPVVALTGQDGQPYPTSPPVVDGAVVRSDVGRLGPAGTYIIAYRVVSVDGHPVTGQVQFEFAPAAPPVTEVPAVPTTRASPEATTAAIPTTQSGSSNQVPPSTAAEPSRSNAAATDSTTEAAPSELAVVAAEQSSGVSGWIWAAIVGVLVLVITAGVVVVRQRRQPSGGGA
jgi:copper resistance protein C